MKVMGVDVGYSTTRATTGIACLDGDRLFLMRAGTTWESRKACIPRGFRPIAIALDGPLLPQGADELIRRRCESLLIHAPFHNRCKPGLSHWGKGLELRRASADASAQFSRAFAHSPPKKRIPHAVVEAFPNAFLGVLTPEEELLEAPKLKRGGRFDWLYERVAATGRLESVLEKELALPDEVWRRMGSEKDHELRSALVCLLTAALAAQGTATSIGEATGGWFWLPPLSLWQPWAIQGLNCAAAAMAMKGQPLDGFRCD